MNLKRWWQRAINFKNKSLINYTNKLKITNWKWIRCLQRVNSLTDLDSFRKKFNRKWIKGQPKILLINHYWNWNVRSQVNSKRKLNKWIWFNLKFFKSRINLIKNWFSWMTATVCWNSILKIDWLKKTVKDYGSIFRDSVSMRISKICMEKLFQRLLNLK